MLAGLSNDPQYTRALQGLYLVAQYHQTAMMQASLACTVRVSSMRLHDAPAVGAWGIDWQLAPACAACCMVRPR